MRIDAVTTCCDPLYVELLSRTLPTWLETCDTVTVVTRPEDSLAIHALRELRTQNAFGEPICGFCGSATSDAYSRHEILHCWACGWQFPKWPRIVETTAFTDGGAHFNKGLALNVGLAAMQADGWIIAFDCDIVPPPWTRAEIDENCSANGVERCLYGAHRYRQAGMVRESGEPLFPFGYFQLWHASDQTYRRSPVFETHHPHAARYDRRFAEQWPPERRLDLGIKLTHLGERSKHWFGVRADPSLMGRLQDEIREELRSLPPKGSWPGKTTFSHGTGEPGTGESQPGRPSSQPRTGSGPPGIERREPGQDADGQAETDGTKAGPSADERRPGETNDKADLDGQRIARMIRGTT